MTVNY